MVLPTPRHHPIVTGDLENAALARFGASAAVKSKYQTRRFLRGRQPLCGIGVTSRIEVMVKPPA
jgi:hypothetical protein